MSFNSSVNLRKNIVLKSSKLLPAEDVRDKLRQSGVGEKGASLDKYEKAAWLDENKGFVMKIEESNRIMLDREAEDDDLHAVAFGVVVYTGPAGSGVGGKKPFVDAWTTPFILVPLWWQRQGGSTMPEVEGWDKWFRSSLEKNKPGQVGDAIRRCESDIKSGMFKDEVVPLKPGETGESSAPLSLFATALRADPRPRPLHPLQRAKRTTSYGE